MRGLRQQNYSYAYIRIVQYFGFDLEFRIGFRFRIDLECALEHPGNLFRFN